MDTIAALATARGQAALGIIRISGPDAGRVLGLVVPRARGTSTPRKMIHGLAIGTTDNQILDEVLCFFAPGPGTATGEDVAEIHAHGGPLVLSAVLDEVLRAGARLAQPGEFSSRAFANGRMDCTQAEAVMSLIGARSARAARVAARHLSGAFGDALDAEYEQLTAIAAELEAGLDFPDEDLPLAQMDRIADRLDQIVRKLEAAGRSYRLGSKLTEGARVAIVGPSNAGKSSLLNRLVKEDRALVDHQPGTTRDVVECHTEIEGVAITFMDTAGLRDGGGAVERRGMEKTRQVTHSADLVLLVRDGTDRDGTQSEAVTSLEALCEAPVILVHNKSDLPGFEIRPVPLPQVVSQITVSAKTGDGMDTLESEMGRALLGEETESELLVTTLRQMEAITETASRVHDGIRILRGDGEPELAATDLRAAREALGTLWGRDASEDVIDEIFSKFCLGK